MSTEAIERSVVRKQGRTDGVILIFSSYNGEKSGPNYDFLSRITDYHYHSGEKTDCYCVGYSAYEPSPDKKNGTPMQLKELFDSPLSYFYPKVFHRVRDDVQQALRMEWQYEGGVDVILFRATSDKVKPINWSTAAVLRSRRHVGTIFQDVDHMIRVLINMNEAEEGGLGPDQLAPEVRQRMFIERLGRYGGNITGLVVGAAARFIFAARA